MERISLIVEVSLSINAFENFSYEFRGDRKEISIGMRVIVPFWNRLIAGWVVSCNSDYKGKVKPIIGIINDSYIPEENYFRFVSAVSKEFMIPRGIILDKSLSPGMRSLGNMFFKKLGNEYRVKKMSLSEISKLANSDTLDIYYKIGGTNFRKRTESDIHREFKVTSYQQNFLLSYNRSGDYNKIVKEMIRSGRTPLILLPNNMSMNRYASEYEGLLIYNSSVKISERERIWSLARSDEAVFIGGGESALFLPVVNPGTIIVEKPGSFFYDRNMFSGIDLRKVARIKADIFNMEIIEGDSSYTVYHSHKKKSINILDKRDKKTSKIVVNKFKPGLKMITDDVIDSIVSGYIDKKRILVIVNKKVSTGFLYCDDCKIVAKCPVCGNSIVSGKSDIVKCIRCGFKSDNYGNCKKCSNELNVIEDISVSSVKNSIGRKVGEGNVIKIDDEKVNDLKKSFGISEMDRNKIIITTPVFINNIPSVSFDIVFIVKPESFFDLNKYNGSEQMFTFISELRELIPKSGEIAVFSVFHFHYSLKYINDEERFFEKELKYREFFMLPPYYELFKIELNERDLRKLAKKMREFYKKFKELLNIKNIYISSRIKKRGYFKGVIHIRSDYNSIIKSGISKIKGLKIIKEI